MLVPLAIVEQRAETLGGADPEVVGALGTDVEVCLEVLVVDDLRASGHFTQRPSGTRLGFSAVAEAIGFRAFLNHAIRPDFSTIQSHRAGQAATPLLGT